jgi:hypothetical protein
MDGIRGNETNKPANFSIFAKTINANSLLERPDPVRSLIQTFKFLLHKGAFLATYCKNFSVFSKASKTSIISQQLH